MQFLALLGLGLGAAAGAPLALLFQGGLSTVTFGGRDAHPHLPFFAEGQRLGLVAPLGGSMLRAMRAGALAVRSQTP